MREERRRYWDKWRKRELSIGILGVEMRIKGCPSTFPIVSRVYDSNHTNVRMERRSHVKSEENGSADTGSGFVL
jgi:hypothetical protein